MSEEINLETLNVHNAVLVGSDDVELAEEVISNKLIGFTPDVVIDSIVSMCTLQIAPTESHPARSAMANFCNGTGYQEYSSVKDGLKPLFLECVRTAMRENCKYLLSLFATFSEQPTPFLWCPGTKRTLESWKRIFGADANDPAVETIASIISPVYFAHYAINNDTGEKFFDEGDKSKIGSVFLAIMYAVKSYTRSAPAKVKSTFAYPNLDLIPFSKAETDLVNQLPKIPNTIPATSFDMYLLRGSMAYEEHLNASRTISYGAEVAKQTYLKFNNIGVLFFDVCSSITSGEGDDKIAEDDNFAYLRTLFNESSDGYATFGVYKHLPGNSVKVDAEPMQPVDVKQSTIGAQIKSAMKASVLQSETSSERAKPAKRKESPVTFEKTVKVAKFDTDSSPSEKTVAVEANTVTAAPDDNNTRQVPLEERCLKHFMDTLQACKTALQEAKKVIDYDIAKNRSPKLDLSFCSSTEEFERRWQRVLNWLEYDYKFINQVVTSTSIPDPIVRQLTQAAISSLRDEIIRDVGAVNMLRTVLEKKASNAVNAVANIRQLPVLLLKQAAGQFLLLIKPKRETVDELKLAAGKKALDETASEERDSFLLDPTTAKYYNAGLAPQFRDIFLKRSVLGQCQAFYLDVQSVLYEYEHGRRLVSKSDSV